MNSTKLQNLIDLKHVKNVDLSKMEINGYDFSNCKLENVVFATDDQQDREIKNIHFKDAKLIQVSFSGASLVNCNFDGKESKLEKVSFMKCNLTRCRFRNTTISWSDFRYTEINTATFEGSTIDFSDFYRAFFVGVVIFRNSRISNCSLYYTYFDEGSTIRKENLVNGKILQQNKSAYRKFLVDWNMMGTGLRKNDQNSVSDWSPVNSLKARYADAEDIYKTLNGLWMSKGFLGEANWAYVKGKKMERNRLIADLTNSEVEVSRKLRNIPLIIWNYLSDAMFGYGESMIRMVMSYIFMVFMFAYFYYASSEVSLPNYARAVGISFKNMVAMSSDEVSNVSPLIDFLNIIQTTIGILITGIFGFILGNKIRNQ